MTHVSKEASEPIAVFSAHLGILNSLGSANPINDVQVSVGADPNWQYDPWAKTDLSQCVVVPAESRPDTGSGTEAQIRSAEPSQGGARTSPWITEALKEVEEIDQAVEEDNLPAIEPKTKTNVRSLLRAIARKGVATVPIVYPTEWSEVAVYFHSKLAACAIRIKVGNDGRGSFVYVPERYEDRCAHYCDATVLPDHIVLHKCLDKLNLDR